MNFRNGDGDVRLCGAAAAAGAAMDCSLHSGSGPAERLQVAIEFRQLSGFLTGEGFAKTENRSVLRVGVSENCVRNV